MSRQTVFLTPWLCDCEAAQATFLLDFRLTVVPPSALEGSGEGEWRLVLRPSSVAEVSWNACRNGLGRLHEEQWRFFFAIRSELECSTMEQRDRNGVLVTFSADKPVRASN